MLVLWQFSQCLARMIYGFAITLRSTCNVYFIIRKFLAATVDPHSRTFTEYISIRLNCSHAPNLSTSRYPWRAASTNWPDSMARSHEVSSRKAHFCKTLFFFRLSSLFLRQSNKARRNAAVRGSLRKPAHSLAEGQGVKGGCRMPTYPADWDK